MSMCRVRLLHPLVRDGRVLPEGRETAMEVRGAVLAELHGTAAILDSSAEITASRALLEPLIKNRQYRQAHPGMPDAEYR